MWKNDTATYMWRRTFKSFLWLRQKPKGSRQNDTISFRSTKWTMRYGYDDHYDRVMDVRILLSSLVIPPCNYVTDNEFSWSKNWFSESTKLHKWGPRRALDSLPHLEMNFHIEAHCSNDADAGNKGMDTWRKLSGALLETIERPAKNYAKICCLEVIHCPRLYNKPFYRNLSYNIVADDATWL